MMKNQTGRNWVAFLFLAGLAASAAVAADADKEAGGGGTARGILTAKSDTWIEVKSDGAKESERYLPFWRGGAPKDGGGFDKDMLATIKSLVPANRVELVWKMEEHRRIVNVKMLVTESKSGTVQGTVAAKGENWIDVKPADGAVERYMPRWIGGAPADGGGFDKDMVSVLSRIKVGDEVSLKWLYDERKRVVEIK